MGIFLFCGAYCFCGQTIKIPIMSHNKFRNAELGDMAFYLIL